MRSSPGAVTVILLAVLALLPVPGASGVTLYVQRVVVADPGDLRLGDLVQASGDLSPEEREALAMSVAVIADRVLYIPVSWYRAQLDAAFGPGAILVGTRTLVIPRGSSMDGQAYLADRLADWIQSQSTETKTEITIGSLTARGTPPADGTPVIQATRNTPGSTDVSFSLSGSAGGSVAGRITLAASPGTRNDAASPAVKSGTAINVVFKKGLITIEMPGKTLGSASVGDPVSVLISDSQKTFSGQLIDGKAVEVDLPRPATRCAPARHSAVQVAAVLVLILMVSAAAGAAPTVRIKDIATVQGLRANQLIGLGLVTGLDGKGDSSTSSLLRSSLSSLVASFGVTVAPADVRSRNAAVVMISAELPPFSRAGDTIDITVSSIGDARDLDGGILLQANLQAANGQTYAVAQGRVMTTPDPNAAKTVGTISDGAIVEKDVVSQFLANNVISIILRNPDFVTATAVRKAIEAAFSGIKVTTPDASLIEVQLPDAARTDPVGFLAQLEALTVAPDANGRVVINASSGVIVMGEKVRIGKVAVSYRTARVTVGGGSTSGTTTPDVFVINETTTVDDFVASLKAVGLKADVIIGVLKAVEQAGALYGTLLIM